MGLPGRHAKIEIKNKLKKGRKKSKKLKSLILFFIDVETLFMRFTLDLDMFFDFLTPFSFILRFQPILPLQKSRESKNLTFGLFAGFSTLGHDCEGDFELTFDFHTNDLTKYKQRQHLMPNRPVYDRF